MLTRALMLNPLLRQFPAPRVLGRYLTLDGKIYNVTWDASTKRLTTTYLAKKSGTFQGVTQYYQEMQTAVSSQARAAYTKSNGRIGLYSVSAAGLGADPAVDYPVPTSSFGSFYDVNGNGDAIFLKEGNPPQFQVRNIITGATAVTVGQASYSSVNTLYNCGDGWLTQIQPVNGERSGQQAWTVGANGLTIFYPVDSTGVGCLAAIASPGVGSKVLAMAGIPRVLPSANKIFLVRISPSGNTEALHHVGPGAVAIPATVYVEEVNVDNGLASLSKAYWGGHIVATMTGTRFVPLTLYYGAQTDVPVEGVPPSDAYSERYVPTTNAKFANALNYRGQFGFLPTGILPRAASMYRRANTLDPASQQYLPAGIRIVDPSTANPTVDPVPNPTGRTNIGVIPHIGAVVLYGSNSTSPTDLASIRISFDGVNFTDGICYTAREPNGTPTLGGGITGLVTAIPLFL